MAKIAASYMIQFASDVENDGSASGPSAFCALISTTPIVEPAVTAAGITMDEWHTLGHIEARPTSNQLVLVTLTLEPGGLMEGLNRSAAVDKILRGVCERASAALTGAWERQTAAFQAEITPLLKQREEAAAKWEQLRQTADDLQSKLESFDRQDRSAYDNLVREKHETERTLAGDRAKVQSYEKEPPVKPIDEVVGPLAKEAFHKADDVVEFRKKRVEALKQRLAKGTATQEQVEDAEFAMIDARIFSIAYAASITGISTLYGYVQQRYDDPRPELRGAVAAAEAKLKVLDEHLAALPKPATRPSDRLSRAQLDRAQQAANEAKREQEALARKIEELRSRNRIGPKPQIIVLSAPTAMQSRTTTHVVREGESLSSISIQHYGNPRGVEAIRNANPQVESDRLRIGDALTLPEIPSLPTGTANDVDWRKLLNTPFDAASR